MRTVRMKYYVSGGRADGTDWPAKGELLTCSDDEAAGLVAGQLAEWADDEAPAPAPEPAVTIDIGPPDPPPPPAGQLPVEPPAPVEPSARVEPPAATDSTATVSPPPVRAARADWAQHAVSQGADPDAVDEMTKAQLIATYGNNAGNGD